MKIKDYITLLNGVAGFFGIILSLQGNQIAPLYIIPALIFDFLDGRFARRAKPDFFGKELDSLSDVVSFRLIFSKLVYVFAPNPLVFIALIFYICSGLIRLARFNVQKEKGVFFGLPSPLAAVIVLAVFLLNNPLLMIMSLLAVGFFMTSGFKIKKI
ncbi:MAG: CDP-alcohol phosphatidyltransferase family protein [Candidatus Marsarchaeota archaeon]|nr:CDP-alcohol phosphatidyltransferase family protein [Candidatus Marsarchaeota archaeon]